MTYPPPQQPQQQPQYGLPPRQQQQRPGEWPAQPPQHSPGAHGYRPPPRPPRRRRTGLWVTLSIVGTLFVIVIIAAAASAGKNGSGGPGAAAKPGAGQTVTYVVTGSRGAQVIYGPAGSSLNGHVPMHLTKPLGSPSYYSVTAQLQGRGAVTCQILVDGKVISRSTATGSYNIAQCEITDFGDGWQDANS